MNDISNRFEYHKPTPEKVKKHEGVRADCISLALNFMDDLPESREKSLALMRLEEAMFWANAAIARN